MKIELIRLVNGYDISNWRYFANELAYTRKQYDYIFKYLDFNQLDKSYFIFNNCEIKFMFYRKYMKSDFIFEVQQQCPEGYEYLKNNWGKGVFSTSIFYQNKQELKTIVNKIINVELIRSKQ